MMTTTLQPRSVEMENGEDEENPEDDRRRHSAEVLDQVRTHPDDLIINIDELLIATNAVEPWGESINRRCKHNIT